MSGFAITKVNNDKIVVLFYWRYVQKRIIQAYMQTGLDLPAPMNTISSLQTFYSKTEIYIRGLELFDQMESSYGALYDSIDYLGNLINARNACPRVSKRISYKLTRNALHTRSKLEKNLSFF